MSSYLRLSSASAFLGLTFAGLTVAGLQCGPAQADPLTRDGSPSSASADTGNAQPTAQSSPKSAAGVRAARPGRPAGAAAVGGRARAARVGGTAPVNSPAASRAEPRGRAVPLPAAAAAQPATAAAKMSSVGNGLNTLLTNTANRLARLPGGPIAQVLDGAVYLVRRTLFPTSVGVVNKPVVVPLTLTKVDDGPNKKLGIYVGLGSDAPPALFELDTGGIGIYGAYASSSPNNSPWWGSGVVTTTTPTTVIYDSGNSYQGFIANSQVYLYPGAGTQLPLLATGRANVGQMDKITKKNKDLWTPDGLPNGDKNPPIDKAFYGDFGLSQPYNAKGITNVLAQLVYTRGVLPGYRIHVDEATGAAWLQIGLTKADIQDPAGRYFPEVIDPTAPSWARNPRSGLRYYSEQVFNANIKISTAGKDATTIINSVEVGMTTDTGASTTLHNTDLAPIPLPIHYAGITEYGNLEQDLNFTVTGTTTSGTQGQVFNFTTVSPSDKADLGVVSVQNGKASNTTYYLNTGILLFYQNDVVYYLGNRSGGGLIGLI